MGTVRYFSRWTADDDDLCQFLLLYALCILFVMFYASCSMIDHFNQCVIWRQFKDTVLSYSKYMHRRCEH